MNYKKRLFLYFLLVFTVFAVSVIGFEQWRERDYRAEMLASTLKAYSYSAYENPSSPYLPSEMRVTVIDKEGNVNFDNDANERTMENHSDRPEVIGAKTTGTGHHIRTSETTGHPYFYFARRTDTGYVRVALPYDAETRSLLAPDKYFVIFVLTLFVVAMLFLWMIAKRFGRDLEDLKKTVVDEVRARAQLKAEMTSAIAHELRTPTSAIRSYSETLCEEGIDEVYKAQFIRRIHSASLRLSELLENVSLLTKMEEAPSKFYNEQVNITKITRDVSEEFITIAAKNSVTIMSNLPEDVMVRGSKTLIYSIWRNLVENAIKYGGQGITVKLSLESESSTHYVFSVADNGTGLDSKHIPRLFERFYRVDSGRTRDDGGSGLGLSIVAHAVQHHKGAIDAFKGDDGGFVVRFSIKKQVLDTDHE